MKRLSISVILAALLAIPALSAVAASDQPTPIAVVAETLRAEAEVLSVDAKNRILVVKLPSGEIVELTVDKAVKNLAQVHTGDAIVTEYQQALVVKLKKGAGTRSTVESEGKARAKPGQEPAAVKAREIDFVADVIDVSPTTGLITILGAKGNTIQLRASDPKILSEIKKGDQVEGSYIQALAVAVVPPKASVKK